MLQVIQRGKLYTEYCKISVGIYGSGNHLLDAVVKEGQTGVLVANEGALLNETDEDLGLSQLAVELLVGAVPAL